MLNKGTFSKPGSKLHTVNKLTFVAEVINHDYLCQVVPGSPLDDAVDGSHKCGPTFIMEDNHDTRG